MITLSSSRTKQRVFLLFVAVLAVSVLFTTPVAADGHDENKGFICDGNEQVQTVFRYMVGLFMVFGFVFGILIWTAAKFETSVLGGQFKVLGGLGDEGNEALKSAFLLPLAVYFFDLIDVMLFGIEIGCVVPKP